MSIFTFWIGETDADGSHCDTNSHHIIEVGNITDATEQEATAMERDDVVVWIDAPIDQNTVYDIESGQNFTMYRTEADEQGVNCEPKHGPGY
jgi:hypothetical protein